MKGVEAERLTSKVSSYSCEFFSVSRSDEIEGGSFDTNQDRMGNEGQTSAHAHEIPQQEA